MEEGPDRTARFGRLPVDSRFRRALSEGNPIIFTTVAGLAGFSTHFAMYAFRAPFTAAT